MSNKLDQSLDTIMTENKSARPARGGPRTSKRRAATKVKKATAAPTGGVQKNTKTPTAPAVKALNGESKIIVGNLPMDVTETLIKDFFSKAIGGVKKVLLSYGPNGRSRGEATVTFNKPDAGARAAKEYNGVNVDNRPMRIEVVGGAATAAAGSKSLSDRIAKPKNAAKENQKATTKKDGPKPATNGAAKAAKPKKAGRTGKPKAKTADELDAEMADYFGGDSTNGAANGATTGAAPAASTAMEDADQVL